MRFVVFPTSNPGHRRKVEEPAVLVTHQLVMIVLVVDIIHGWGSSPESTVQYVRCVLWAQGNLVRWAWTKTCCTWWCHNQSHSSHSWSKTDSNQESEFANILLQSHLSFRVWVKRPCLMCWRCATETTGSTRDGQVLWVAKGCLEWKIQFRTWQKRKKHSKIMTSRVLNKRYDIHWIPLISRIFVENHPIQRVCSFPQKILL